MPTAALDAFSAWEIRAPLPCPIQLTERHVTVARRLSHGAPRIACLKTNIYTTVATDPVK